MDIFGEHTLKEILHELREIHQTLKHCCGHRRLFVFFLAGSPSSNGKENMGGLITSILTTDTAAGALLTIAEMLNGQPVQSSGPFSVSVQDPAGAATVTPGSADNTTPTRITANGSNNVGDVTVTVTDENDQAVGSGVLHIVAPPPPPPPVPTLTVGFVAGTAPAPAPTPTPAPAPAGT